MSGKFEFGEEDRTALLLRAWDLALHLLASKVNSAAFGYIQPIQPLSYVGNVVTLGVANAFFRDRLEKNHSNAIRSALEFHLDTTGLQVVLVVMSREQQRNAESRRQRPRHSSQQALPLDETDERADNLEHRGDYHSGRADDWGSGETIADPAAGETDATGNQRYAERDAVFAHTQQRANGGSRPIPNGRNPLAYPPNVAESSGYTGALPYIDLGVDSKIDSKIDSNQSNLTGSVSPAGSTRGDSNNRARSTTTSTTITRSGSGNAKPAERTPKATKADQPVIPCLPLNDRYVFANFLVGKSNRLAHAGATGVAERPGELYNPLFIYGGPGLGKTHLMQGIAHTIRHQRPGMRIAYVSGEYFAQQYITSIRERSTEDFRRQYREVDVWLVDDIQFVAGKEHSKEEFFHTFNTLYQSGKQIVIASDRSPRELNTMDERLRSRFQSGLIADISAPDLETRIAILHQCRQREGFNVENRVLEYIASAIQSNIRALEGALTKLIAYSSIHKTAATAELAQSVLSEYFIDKPISLRKVTLDGIVEAVAAVFGVSPAAIKGPHRNKEVSLARQVAMYLSRELLPEMNTTDLGAAFGNRDHATIIYSSQRIRGLIETDPELKTAISQLQKKILLPDPI